MSRFSVHRPTYRDEEYAPKQGAGQRRLDNLLQAGVAGLVTFDQGCDVEGHLGDGAERGVHQRAHRKVTLGRDTAETRGVRRRFELRAPLEQAERSFRNRFMATADHSQGYVPAGNLMSAVGRTGGQSQTTTNVHQGETLLDDTDFPRLQLIKWLPLG